MKKIWLLFLFISICVKSEADPKWGSGFDEADLVLGKNSVQFHEVDSTPVCPPADEIKVYGKDDSGTTKLFTLDSACAERELGAGGLEVGVTEITGGTDTRVLFNDGGTVGEDAGFTYVKGTDTATIGQIIDSGLTASRAVYSDSNKQLASSATSDTELGYVDGVTSAIQTQLDAKQTSDATLTALAAYNTNGLLTQTAADTFAGRTLTEGLALDVTNGDGVSGNPTVAFDSTELTGARTWGDGTDSSIAWTWNLSGTDRTLTLNTFGFSFGNTAITSAGAFSGNGNITSTSTTNSRIGLSRGDNSSYIATADFSTAGTVYFQLGLMNNHHSGSNAFLSLSDGSNELASFQDMGTTGNFYLSGAIELGHASDTTISKSASGVIAVEGVVIPSISSTSTLTNKRITKREVSVADATSITPDSDASDTVTQANTQATGTLTINNPTGTPTASQVINIRLKSTNVQTFSWGSQYRGSSDQALPTTSTGSGKYDYMGFQWNSVDSKWDMAAKNFGF